jgi:hypothetical protein
MLATQKAINMEVTEIKSNYKRKWKFPTNTFIHQTCNPTSWQKTKKVITYGSTGSSHIWPKCFRAKLKNYTYKLNFKIKSRMTETKPK